MDISNIPLQITILGAAIAACTEAIKRAGGPHPAMPRILPLIPLLLGGCAAVVLPTMVPGPDLAAKLIWGILAGALSGQCYSLLRRQYVAATNNPAPIVSHKPQQQQPQQQQQQQTEKKEEGKP